MLVSCKSWRSRWQAERYSDNPHCLADRDIARLTPAEDHGAAWGDLLQNAFINTVDDGVLIETGVEDLNIHGNHVVQVQLTKNEIANLVRIAWDKNQFGQFVEALSKAAPSSRRS